MGSLGMFLKSILVLVGAPTLTKLLCRVSRLPASLDCDPFVLCTIYSALSSPSILSMPSTLATTTMTPLPPTSQLCVVSEETLPPTTAYSHEEKSVASFGKSMLRHLAAKANELAVLSLCLVIVASRMRMVMVRKRTVDDHSGFLTLK